MTDWVPDKSLPVLIKQVDEAAPGRRKDSDGLKGDPAHAARVSDHNPEDSADADAPGNPDEQVDAADITHDIEHGADMGVVTEAIRVSKDKRVKYVIFNKRIFSGPLEAKRAGLPAFEWGPYHGTDPHTGHAHVSVEDATHDQTQPWSIGIGGNMSLTPGQDIQLDASMVRDEARVSGQNPYAKRWGGHDKEQENSFELRQLHKIDDILDGVTRAVSLLEDIAAAVANPPAGGTGTVAGLTATELAASLRTQADALLAGTHS